MNTHAGYSKKKLDNDNVLLAGGGEKSLTEFLGGIRISSSKIQYKAANAAADWTDLITLVNTDENVKQVDNNNNQNSPILLKNGTGTGTITSSSIFADGVTINPKNNALSVSGYIDGKILISGGSYNWYSFQQYNSSDANPTWYDLKSAIININSYSGWLPWIRGIDSEKGSWCIGQYTTNFHVAYIAKANTNNTTTKRWDFGKDGKLTSPGGFVHGGLTPPTGVSKDAYVLLAGGGYKEVSDFATSTHNHDGRYVMKHPGSDVDPSTTNGYWHAMTTLSGITSNWWHIMHMDWQGGANWRSELALPTQDRNGVYYRSDNDPGSGWVFGNWVKLLDTGNWSDYCAAKSHNHGPLLYINGTSDDLPRICWHIPNVTWANISLNTSAVFSFKTGNAATSGTEYLRVGSNYIHISGTTNATMTSSTTNPRIVFSENWGTQPVYLVYTDYDSYRSPAGLKVIGGTDATPAWFEVEGDVWARHYYESSDIRLKHDISMISKSIRKFKYNSDDKLCYGFIAQELEELHPELVDNSGEYKTVNYNSAICYYIAELENKVLKLEERLQKLENIN